MAEKSDKIIMREEVGTLSGYQLDGHSLDRAAAYLLEEKKRLQKTYGTKFEKYVLDWRRDRYDETDYQFGIFGVREETDEEYSTRMSQCKLRDEQQRERDLKEYHRLQKLFQSKTD